jgi:hypothetical protein
MGGLLSQDERMDVLQKGCIHGQQTNGNQGHDRCQSVKREFDHRNLGAPDTFGRCAPG